MNGRSSRGSEKSLETVNGGKKRDRTIIFDPFFRRAAAITGLVAAVVVLLLFLWTVSGVLLLVFAGILLAVFLNGIARLFSDHTPLSYGRSLFATCVLLTGLSVFFVWMIAPPVAEQVGELRDVLPQSVNRLEEQLNEYGWGEFIVDRMPEPRELISSGGGFWSRVTGFLSTAVGLLANVLIILVLGIYFAASPGLYERGITRLVPPDKEEKARETLKTIGHALWGWLIGQLISMSIIGVLVWLGLVLLGVPLALALGFIAALTEFVPLIGPWVGAVPGLLVALLARQPCSMWDSFISACSNSKVMSSHR